MASKKKPTAKQSLLDSMAGLSGKVETSDSAIATVAALAEQQIAAALEVAAAEDELKKKKEALDKIASTDLPEAMKAAGLEKFTTTGGLEISVKKDIQCGITEVRREAAYEWLIENGYEGLIKSEIDILFGRDERKKAEKLLEQLKKKNLEVNFKNSIHAATLKSFVKERMEDTESETPFPTELFGVFPFDKAIVKPTKARKMAMATK